MDKLFIVIRSDLDPGAQAAQAVHVFKAFQAAHPAIEQAWYSASNNLVLLAAPDEAALRILRHRASEAGVATASFHEPDFDNSLTGIALAPSGAKLVSCLPLALRTRRADRLTLPASHSVTSSRTSQ